MENRGLVLELDNLPFPVSKSMNQLIDQIENFNEFDYSTSIEKFNQKYEVFESGEASKEIGDRIINEMSN